MPRISPTLWHLALAAAKAQREKTAFIPPEGFGAGPGDPAAAGAMPPGDPSMGGAMPPGDPMAAGAAMGGAMGGAPGGDPVQAIAQAVITQLQQSGLLGGAAGPGRGVKKQDEMAQIRMSIQRMTMLMAKMMDYLNVPFKAEDLVSADMQATDPNADPMAAVQAGMGMNGDPMAGGADPMSGGGGMEAGPKMAEDTLEGEQLWVARILGNG